MLPSLQLHTIKPQLRLAIRLATTFIAKLYMGSFENPILQHNVCSYLSSAIYMLLLSSHTVEWDSNWGSAAKYSGLQKRTAIRNSVEIYSNARVADIDIHNSVS